MNDVIKKLCPLAAIVCFVVCIIGAVGIINAAPAESWQSVGIFCLGVSVFVLLVPFMVAGLYCCRKEQAVEAVPAEARKQFKPANKPFKKERPADKPAAAKPAPRPAVKPAVKPADKPIAKAAEKPVVKVADKPAPRIDEEYEDQPGDREFDSFDNDDVNIRRDNGEQISEESGPTTLYVCNLTADITEGDIREEFEVFGPVKSVRLVTDKESGTSKGYAFVEMTNRAEASLAIDDINGQEIKGQQVSVSIARKKPAFNRRWNNKRSQ